MCLTFEGYILDTIQSADHFLTGVKFCKGSFLFLCFIYNGEITLLHITLTGVLYNGKEKLLS